MTTGVSTKCDCDGGKKNSFRALHNQAQFNNLIKK